MENEEISPSENTPQPQKMKKVKAKFGLKPFAFFSGLFDTIISLAILALGFFAISGFFHAIDSGNDAVNLLSGIFFLPFVIIIFTLFGVTGILFMVMGILTLISSFKSDRKNWNSLLVTVLVFDILLLIPSVFMTAISDEGSRIIWMVLAILLFVGFVFKIIDICLTKRRLKKYQNAKQEEIAQTYTGPNFDNLSENSGENKSSDQQQNSQENSNDVDFSKLGK